MIVDKIDHPEGIKLEMNKVDENIEANIKKIGKIIDQYEKELI